MARREPREQARNQKAEQPAKAGNRPKDKTRDIEGHRLERVPPNSILPFHGALKRLFPVEREIGPAFFTPASASLLVPAIGAPVDQNLVA